MSLFPIRKSKAADLAIDFGTANMVLSEKGAGILFDEPSMCCFVDDHGRRRLHAAGAEAQAISERVTGTHRIARPLSKGVMSDIDAGRELLRYAVGRSVRKRLFGRAKAIVGVPADATQAERQALITAVRDAGLGSATLFEEPLMAAVGAGLDVGAPRGRMLVDCGAGTTEVAVISLGGICLSKSVRIGGDTLDEAIVAHLHMRHHLDIGLRTAEKVKRDIAALDGTAGDGREIEITGKSTTEGLPVRVSIPASELIALTARHAETVADTVRLALAETPPELSRDVLEDGVTLTGGSSMIALLSRAIARKTGLDVRIADHPRDCVALGLAAALDGQA